MEKESREVIYSDFYFSGLKTIYLYGKDTFDKSAADIFIHELSSHIRNLSYQFLSHPECRYLLTKRKLYRNLIFGSYRITPARIEILRAFHGSRSPSVKRTSRSIRL